MLTLPSSDYVLTLEAEQPLSALEQGVCNDILSSFDHTIYASEARYDLEMFMLSLLKCSVSFQLKGRAMHCVFGICNLNYTIRVRKDRDHISLINSMY